MQGYEALRDSVAVLDLAGRGRIFATGEDRARLLHAMTTNHVEQLRPGGGLYAFFLTAQGRIIADARLFCLEDAFLIDTEPEARERLYQHLDKFIIADDVTLEDASSGLACLGVEGPGAADCLRQLGAPLPDAEYGIAAWGERWVARANSTGQPGYLIFARDAAALAQELHGLPTPDTEAVETVRIENGKARYGVDFTEANIPQETQLPHALNFSKGCYLGQEIVERVRSRGHVNRMVSALEVAGNRVPARSAKITADGKEVGEITSAALSPASGTIVAMGILRTEARQPSVALSVDGAAASLRRAS